MKTRLLALCCVLACGVSAAAAQSNPGWLRYPSISPDGKAIIYASERGGRWAIYEARKTRDEEPCFYASTLVKETPVIANAQQNYQPLYSPDGKGTPTNLTLSKFNDDRATWILGGKAITRGRRRGIDEADQVAPGI